MIPGVSGTLSSSSDSSVLGLFSLNRKNFLLWRQAPYSSLLLLMSLLGFFFIGFMIATLSLAHNWQDGVPIVLLKLIGFPCQRISDLNFMWFLSSSGGGVLWGYGGKMGGEGVGFFAIDE